MCVYVHMCHLLLRSTPHTLSWVSPTVEQSNVAVAGGREDGGKPLRLLACESGLLVHGWDTINKLNSHSLLGLSTLKNVKCYPTLTKVVGFRFTV